MSTDGVPSVCVSPVIGVMRRVLYCRRCRRKRRHLVRCYEWYEPGAACLTCRPELRRVKDRKLRLPRGTK